MILHFLILAYFSHFAVIRHNRFCFETEEESEMSERRDTTSQDESDHSNDRVNRSRKRRRIVTSQDSSDNEMDE